MSGIPVLRARRLLGLILLLALGAGAARAFYVPGGQVGRLRLFGLGAGGGPPQRIVSLAPNLTETLFALGAGPQVKGVTDFCAHPPEAARLPKVGGYYDPNYEALLGLNPDLVVILPEHREQRLRLQRLGIPTLTVEMSTLAGIAGAYLVLGQVCQREAQGAWLAHTLRRELAAARAKSAGGPPKSVLLVLGRDYGSGAPGEVYIAGRGEFYDELLAALNARNAYAQPTPKYPRLSAEGVLSLDPDLIIELVPDLSATGLDAGALRRDWDALPGLRAASAGRVYVLAGDYLVIPGPRLPRLLRGLGRILHPEAPWD